MKTGRRKQRKQENYSEEIGKTIVENNSPIPSPLVIDPNNQTRCNFGCAVQQCKVLKFYK